MDRVKQNYLITQIIKGVPMEKVETRPEEVREEEMFNLIRQSEADTEQEIYKRRLLG